MTDSDVPVILFATFTAHPGHADEVAALIYGYAAAVRAEPGNLIFQPSQRVDDDHSFFVYEEYADQAAFDAHLSADKGAAFNAALTPLIVEPQSVLTFLRRG